MYTCVWVGVYQCASVHAWVGSGSVCVCVWVWERKWASSAVFRSVILRKCGSWSLLFVLCVLRNRASLYRVVFQIWFDMLQPMCTDGKPQSISPITALAVRLTFWVCYSHLFKLEHSLISCPWATSVGLDWSACTLSQACARWRLCTVCLLHNTGVVSGGPGIKFQSC